MLSIFRLVLATLAVIAVNACVDETYSQGYCPGGDVEPADGNGAKANQDIVNRLRDCFSAKFGPGPYTIDGPDLPDFGGLGHAWGVGLTDGDQTYQMTIANNCGCTNTMDATIFNTLFDEAEGDGHTSMKITCGGYNCGAGDVPAGMWAAVERCTQACTGYDYQRWEAC